MWQGELLRLLWRRRIVLNIHDLYFQRPVAYYLNNLNADVDNPDQRLTQECVDGGGRSCVFWPLLSRFRVRPGRFRNVVTAHPHTPLRRLAVVCSVDDFTTQAGVLLFGSFQNFYSAWYTLVSMAISLWYVLTHLSWFAIAVSLAYCAIASIISFRIIVPIARRTFATTAALGALRFVYARIQVRPHRRPCRGDRWRCLSATCDGIAGAGVRGHDRVVWRLSSGSASSG